MLAKAYGEIGTSTATADSLHWRLLLEVVKPLASFFNREGAVELLCTDFSTVQVNTRAAATELNDMHQCRPCRSIAGNTWFWIWNRADSVMYEAGLQRREEISLSPNIPRTPKLPAQCSNCTIPERLPRYATWVKPESRTTVREPRFSNCQQLSYEPKEAPMGIIP